jgi:hypothetical protein
MRGLRIDHRPCDGSNRAKHRRWTADPDQIHLSTPLCADDRPPVPIDQSTAPGFRAGFPKPTDLPALRDAYRREGDRIIAQSPLDPNIRFRIRKEQTLLARAGLGDDPDAAPAETEAAIRADVALTDEQKNALLAVYQSYVAANRT